MQTKTSLSNKIFFSVLLVLRNEENYIARLIDTIKNQDFPSDNYELIIVDGMSTDRTVEIVERYLKEDPSFIRLFTNEKKTLPPGWNLGIREAKGDYVLRIDGHTEVPTNFLSNYWETINKQPTAACVGGIIESKGRGFQGEINEYVYSHPFGVGNSKFRTETGVWEGVVDTVPYGAYKKTLFEQVGYFNEALKRNEDIEFHKRVRNHGYKFYLSTKIRSTYYVRETLKGLMDKSMGDGMWSMIANRVTPGSLSLFKKAPLYAFIVGLCLLLGVWFHPVFLIALIGAVSAYLLLDSYFSFQFAKRKGIRYFFPCILTFFCMHFFRGLGSFLAFFKKEYWLEGK